MNMMEQLSSFPRLVREALPAFEHVEEGVVKYSKFSDRMLGDHLDHFLDTFTPDDKVTALVEGNTFILRTVDGSKCLMYPITELNRCKEG